MRIIISILFAFALQNAHAELITFKCNYLSSADETGFHKVKNDFKLTFILDTDLDKTYMVAKNGTVDIITVVNETGGGITFIEKTQVGNIMTTTITNDGNSVHSRNSVISGQLVPSQYYGACEQQ